MSTRGGTLDASSRTSESTTHMSLELRRACFDAGASSRVLAQVCARPTVDLVELNRAVQQARTSIGLLHEAVTALLLTRE